VSRKWHAIVETGRSNSSSGLCIGAVVAVMACGGRGNPPVDSAKSGTNPTHASEEPTSRVSAIPARKTPSLADAGVTKTDISQLTARERERYLDLLSFDSGGGSDEAECPSDSCQTGDHAVVDIQPEAGSFKLTEADFDGGWHIVAKITLADPTKPHHRWKLDADNRVAYWWVGLVNGKLRTIVMRGGGNVISVPAHPFCMRRDTSPTGAKAMWQIAHGGACLNPTARVALGEPPLTPADSAAIRSFHLTWFACDVGCCGSVE
jgi:hypothetical protein